MTVLKIYCRYCLSCQRTLYYPLYKVSAVKRNHNDNKDDDVPPEAFLLIDNLMLEVTLFVCPSSTMNVKYARCSASRMLLSKGRMESC